MPPVSKSTNNTISRMVSMSHLFPLSASPNPHHDRDCDDVEPTDSFLVPGRDIPMSMDIDAPSSRSSAALPMLLARRTDQDQRREQSQAGQPRTQSEQSAS